MVKREDAARYVGVSPTKFDQLVAERRMPRPKKIDARRVWDVRKLDEAIDDLPDAGDDTASPFDRVVA